MENEFDFELELSKQNLTLAKPELLLPTDFDLRQRALRRDMQTVLQDAAGIIDAGIAGVEDRQKAIDAGRVLQVLAKNIVEFYKPIKHAIDTWKQPILDMEHADSESVKTVKNALASAILEFERKQAEADAQRRLAAVLTMPAGKEGEMPTPVIVQTSLPPKTRGKVDRTCWNAKVVDLFKLIQAVAAKQVPSGALLPNESYLDKRADSDREGFSIPGVVAIKTEKVHFRA
jgi:hypothetical protein